MCERTAALSEATEFFAYHRGGTHMHTASLASRVDHIAYSTYLIDGIISMSLLSTVDTLGIAKTRAF